MLSRWCLLHYTELVVHYKKNKLFDENCSDYSRTITDGLDGFQRPLQWKLRTFGNINNIIAPTMKREEGVVPSHRIGDKICLLNLKVSRSRLLLSFQPPKSWMRQQWFKRFMGQSETTPKICCENAVKIHLHIVVLS